MSYPLFRQLYDIQSGTFTYLLADADSHDALIIDPVFERLDRDLALIQELDLQLRYVVETHCHADHVTAAWMLKLRTGCANVAAAASGIGSLDRNLQSDDVLQVGRFGLEVLETPGHTAGCISLFLPEPALVFTGDCLLIRGCGRTDFQGGSASTLFKSITECLFTLPEETVVYPGHDYEGRTSSTIGEEKRLNPRAGGGANETDFVGYLENMQLPHPKKLEIALPANLEQGRPEEGSLPEVPDWAPVTVSFAGVLEVSPQWVAGHLDDIHLLDVRTRHETDEEPTRISTAQLIPLDELRGRLGEVPTDKPVMTLCRSGRRSVMAFKILREHGWSQVANVTGGLLAWYAEGLPVERVAPADGR